MGERVERGRMEMKDGRKRGRERREEEGRVFIEHIKKHKLS